MSQTFVIDFAMESMKTTLLLSAPMLGFGLVAGLLVSIFQAVTSIQELTLTFIPKILAVFLAMILFFPWLLQVIMGFTSSILIHFPDYIR
jgi:flagellar biosynthetic protein FliQ